MKKKYAAILLALVLLSGCGNKKETKKEVVKIDKEVELNNLVSIDRSKYGYYNSSLGDLLLFNKDGKYYVLNITGKELYTGSDVAELYITKDGLNAYYKVNNKIYDSNGEIVKEKLSNLIDKNIKENKDNVSKEIKDLCAFDVNKVSDNIYVCDDIYEDYFIIDGKIDKKYKNITCENSYCVVENNYKKGLYYLSDEIMEPKYSNIILDNNRIILDLGIKYNIYYLDGDNNKLKESDLNPDLDSIDFKIDADKIIKEYNLDKYKKIIDENKYLFNYYAYTIENNDKLGRFKQYLYNYFDFIVEHKDYIDDTIFYKYLSELQYEESDILSIEQAKGMYNGYNNTFSLRTDFKNNYIVIYHELMHFFDMAFNNNKTETVLSYNKEVIGKDEYNELSMEEKRKTEPYKIRNLFFNPIPYFMVEAGAEKYTAQNKFNSEHHTYYDAIALYNMFSYLISEKDMEKVFYSTDNLYDRLNKYIKINEYEKFIIDSFKVVRIDADAIIDNYVGVIDAVVKIYINKNGNEWYSDKKFGYLLYSLIVNNEDKYKKSKYYKQFENEYNNYKKLTENYMEQVKKDTGIEEVTNFTVTYENNDIYFMMLLNESDNDKIEMVKYLYNPKDDTIKQILRDKGYTLKK